jgi:hypothetical protein
MGLVHLYAIASHQLLRTISTHRTCRYPTLLIYPDLIEHINLSFSDVKDAITVWPVVSFRRIKHAKVRHAQEVEVRVSSD